MALAHRSLEIVILACRLLTLELLRSWTDFLSVRSRGLLCRGLLRIHTIGTVEAGAVSIHIPGERVIDVGVVDDVGIHARHSGVVLEGVSAPAPAPVAVSGVAKTVINAAVKTDSRPPVTLIKHVCAVAPAPPRRCPKQTYSRRWDPGARNQIIIPVTPSPVSGSPDVACDRAERLLVYRQRRWSDVDGYAYLRRRQRERQCEKCGEN